MKRKRNRKKEEKRKCVCVCVCVCVYVIIKNWAQNVDENCRSKTQVKSQIRIIDGKTTPQHAHKMPVTARHSSTHSEMCKEQTITKQNKQQLKNSTTKTTCVCLSLLWEKEEKWKNSVSWKKLAQKCENCRSKNRERCVCVLVMGKGWKNKCKKRSVYWKNWSQKCGRELYIPKQGKMYLKIEDKTHQNMPAKHRSLPSGNV